VRQGQSLPADSRVNCIARKVYILTSVKRDPHAIIHPLISQLSKVHIGVPGEVSFTGHLE
jgi:hypothetical protein